MSKDTIGLYNYTLQYSDMDQPVLKDFSIELKTSESTAIIGPSGAGKSTLLRVLNKKYSHYASIPQNLLLIPELSVFHNIYTGRLDDFPTIYNLLNLIRPIKKRVREIEELSSRLGIKDLLFKTCKNLSGGEQQRVAVIRALYRDTPLFFADEPVSAMDPENAKKTLKLLTENRRCISSMHNTNLALQFFDRIIGLKNGTIIFDKPADEIDKILLKELYR